MTFFIFGLMILVLLANIILIMKGEYEKENSVAQSIMFFAFIFLLLMSMIFCFPLSIALMFGFVPFIFKNKEYLGKKFVQTREFIKNLS